LPVEDGTTVPVAGVAVDSGFFRTVTSNTLKSETTGEPGQEVTRRRVDPDLVESDRRIPWSGTDVFHGAQNTAVYPPLFYVPATLAIGASRLLHHKPYSAFMTARFANVFCFLAIGTFSLLLARERRMFLFAALTIPMSLFLAASCSQDGLLVATAVLSVSLLMEAEDGRDRRFVASAALFAALIAVRPIYFPMAAVFAFRFPALPGTGPLGRRLLRPVLLGTLILLPGVVWNVFVQHYVATPFLLPPYHPGPLWPGNPDVLFRTKDPAAQASVFLHRPALALTLPLHAIAVEGIPIWKETIGVLGWLSVELPSKLYWYWDWSLLLLLAGSLFGNRTERALPRSLPLMVVLGTLVSVLAIYDVEYLTWTAVGGTAIQGVQGRYLLILLPFGALALPCIRVRHGSLIRRLSAVPLVLTSIWGVVALPEVLVKAYYL
jgi:hypothetical protein